MEEPNRFAALLNGVVKRHFEKDESVTPQLIKDQVFPSPNVSLEDVERMLEICTKLLADSALHHRQPAQLEAILKKSSFSEVQQEVLVRFWTVNKDKIHALLRKEVTWNNSLVKTSWRLDVKTKSRHIPDMNEPVAIVQLNIGKKKTKKCQQSFALRWTGTNSQKC
jgi:hypothetical protein